MQAILEIITANLLNAVVLTVFVCGLAYLHSPRVKMVLFAMPVPFTCAFLASRMPINASHCSAFILVTAYHWLVLLLHQRWRVPLLPAIVISALCYIVCGAVLKPTMHLNFLALLALAGVLWLVGVWLYKPVVEPGFRSPTPIWLKAPLIFVIGISIYSLSSLMAGAVVSFPYAGVFTSWEMRRSLRTLAGQYMVNNLSGLAMLLAMWLVQDHTGTLGTLAVGWVAMLSVLGAIYWFELGKPQEQAVAAAHAEITELADK